MTRPRIEHVNVTVSDPERAARLMEALFGWRVRWQGPARNGGHTIHVGSDDHYVALYTGHDVVYTADDFAKGRPLNHIGVEVDDLDATEAKVVAAGLRPFSHDDYEPGRRFYFLDPDGIEYEVVSYHGRVMRPVFTHCALHVQDLARSVAFYRDFCRLTVVDEHGEGPNDHAVWMSEEGRTDYVFVLLLGGPPHNQPREDLSHFGFALASRSEVDVMAERGRASGCLAWEPKDFPYPVGYRCALKDPDGYVVEFSYGQPLGPGALRKSAPIGAPVY